MSEGRSAPPPARALATGSAAAAPPPHMAALRARPAAPRHATAAPAAAAPPPDLPRRPTVSRTASPALTPPPQPPELLRRRSSILSDATSYTGDILSPSSRERRTRSEDEDALSHWHSSPLAFALLPAVAGLLFHNGSAFVTDVLLLGLAAVFMNWSIRIPWDWYYSAQAVRRDVDVEGSGLESIGEATAVEVAVETESETDASPDTAPPPQSNSDSVEQQGRRALRTPQAEAAAGLRRQELLALLAAFLFPALSAYLLHLLRAQLSRPSTGLVSDYNLTVFLLAAEIRPARQLVRLVANRTLHLQRLANADELAPITTKSTLEALTARIADLEAKLSDHALISLHSIVAQKTDVTDLSSELRRRYEPRLEGLERAVRRYEKRSTTLAMLTEQRLNSLETRLQDALSLAAVAAQHSQQRGVVSYLLETARAAITLPLKMAWAVAVWPFVVVEAVWERVTRSMTAPRPRVGKRRLGSGRESSGAEEKRRGKEGAVRKMVR